MSCAPVGQWLLNPAVRRRRREGSSIRAGVNSLHSLLTLRARAGLGSCQCQNGIGPHRIGSVPTEKSQALSHLGLRILQLALGGYRPSIADLL
jgi:hypothetical protein